MFRIKINFKGEEKTISFGAWVTGQLEALQHKGSIEIFASIIFFGLVQGEKLRTKYMMGEDLGFDVFDCYDWIDEAGGLMSDDVQRIQKLYIAQSETNVPKNQKATAKATNQKK